MCKEKGKVHWLDIKEGTTHALITGKRGGNVRICSNNGGTQCGMDDEEIKDSCVLTLRVIFPQEFS